MLERWSMECGYRQVLAVGLPLVVSMGSTTVMLFTDRVFLGNYSLDAIAAAMPAGITSFLFISFFMGVASYVNTFIAQYVGAGRPEMVGASLWQGIYFSLGAAVLLASLYLMAGPLFALGGHPDRVVELEVSYFRILTLGAGLTVLNTALSCFFSGRGLTRPVMLINMVGAGFNIPVDYAWINGAWFFPEWGILGAGAATLAAQALMVLLYCGVIFSQANRAAFATWKNREFNRKLFARVMRFGLPGGIQFFLDIFAITFFVFMVGRMGREALAATNIVFSIDTLCFLPMIGFSIAVTTLVGQAIGADRPDRAEEATRSTLHITVIYMCLVAVVFVAFPEPLISIFRPREMGDAEFQGLVATGVVLLRFVAAYSVLDGWALIYFGALKGAGDMYFTMWLMAALSFVVVIVPSYVMVELMGVGLYWVWVLVLLFVASLALAFTLRYRAGKWKRMRVI